MVGDRAGGGLVESGHLLGIFGPLPVDLGRHRIIERHFDHVFGHQPLDDAAAVAAPAFLGEPGEHVGAVERIDRLDGEVFGIAAADADDQDMAHVSSCLQQV